MPFGLKNAGATYQKAIPLEADQGHLGLGSRYDPIPRLASSVRSIFGGDNSFCKVRCFGIPTVDMDNICRKSQVERLFIGLVECYIFFCSRNYDHKKRQTSSVTCDAVELVAHVYPKLIQDAPNGLTEKEADELRRKVKKN